MIATFRNSWRESYSFCTNGLSLHGKRCLGETRLNAAYHFAFSCLTIAMDCVFFLTPGIWSWIFMSCHLVLEVFWRFAHSAFIIWSTVYVCLIGAITFWQCWVEGNQSKASCEIGLFWHSFIIVFCTVFIDWILFLQFICRFPLQQIAYRFCLTIIEDYYDSWVLWLVLNYYWVLWFFFLLKLVLSSRGTYKNW